MDIKKSTTLIARIILLTLVGFITTAIASAVVPQPDIIKAAPSADGSDVIFDAFCACCNFRPYH
jgi:hypothetical protein